VTPDPVFTDGCRAHPHRPGGAPGALTGTSSRPRR